MAGWKNMDFRSKKAKAAGVAFVPRPEATREMVSGLTSYALYKAVKDHAAGHGLPIYKTLAAMELGASTWRRMTDAKPIAQTTALKIVTYLGTSVRAVMGKYHQEKK